jgi:Cof subfamily protein (haloacid dehalogenase superfamily)
VTIRLLAMDIDGTLLDSQGNISAANSAAVAEAAGNGVEIVLVTGRRFHFALPVARMLPCHLHLIVNNGALTKSLDGTTLSRRLLPVATARLALEATKEFRDCASVMFDRPGERQLILERIDWSHPLRASYFRKNSMFLSEESPLEKCLNGEDPIQVGFTGNCAPMRRAMEQLAAHPESHRFALSLTEYADRDLSILDVLRAGVTKGMALAEWSADRGIPRENVMAVGDNFNDLEMLEFAGVPVIMGNAVDELKAKGWPVTGSNDEDGLADAIRRHAIG